MIRWLKRWIRDWLFDEPPTSIECTIDGMVKNMAISGVVGLRLMVSDGRSTMLIGEREASDKEKFWKAWKHHNKANLLWEDGTKFDPLKNMRG